MDIFRGQFGFVYILVILPVTLSTLVPQKTTIMQEFKAFRLQHFDLAGNQRGNSLYEKVCHDFSSVFQFFLYFVL